MRASRSVTVTLLSALMLSSCCYGMWHRGRARDHTWYDARGNVMVEKYKTDAQGVPLRDSAGRTIPDPDVPRDRYGNSWIFVNGAWQPQAPPGSSSSSSYRSSSSLFSGGSSSSSGYRTFSSSGGSSSSSSVFGGSSSSSSISRGGFGSTGTGGSSSSS